MHRGQIASTFREIIQVVSHSKHVIMETHGVTKLLESINGERSRLRIRPEPLPMDSECIVVCINGMIGCNSEPSARCDSQCHQEKGQI